MSNETKLSGFERTLQILDGLYDLLFVGEPKTYTERAPVIANHIERARRAKSRFALVKHATSAYGMIMAGGKDAEHIENPKSEGSFEGYLLLLREVADEAKISEGLAYSYGRDAALNSFVNQTNMYLVLNKKIFESKLAERLFGPHGNRKVPTEILMREIIDASPEEVKSILQGLSPVHED